MISYGHRRDDINGYTLAQIRLYLEAGARHERDNQRRDLSGMLAAVRTAYAGDSDACTKFLRSLED